jgi:hypothetical protein
MAANNGVDIDGIGEFSLERVHPNEARGVPTDYFCLAKERAAWWLCVYSICYVPAERLSPKRGS